jgi:hypothetical protein
MTAKLKSLIIVQDTYFLQALCHKKAHVNYSCTRRTFIKASPLYLFLNILLYSLPSALVYRTYNMYVCRLQSNPFWQPRNLFRNASRLQIKFSLCFVLGKDCLFCVPFKSMTIQYIYSYLQWHLHTTFDILGAEKYSFFTGPFVLNPVSHVARSKLECVVLRRLHDNGSSATKNLLTVQACYEIFSLLLVCVTLNPLRPNGNYMNHLLWQSVMLHFEFIGLVWFSL